MCAVLFSHYPDSEIEKYEEWLISTAGTSQAGRGASAGAFVHSLNILVKYVRLYGFEHKRTETQFEIAWNELQQALPHRQAIKDSCWVSREPNFCSTAFLSKPDRPSAALRSC